MTFREELICQPPIGTVTVSCPVCMERRSYIVSTEVFLGQPFWEVTRVLQGRR
jgi:hypothetical protein